MEFLVKEPEEHRVINVVGDGLQVQIYTPDEVHNTARNVVMRSINLVKRQLERDEELTQTAHEDDLFDGRLIVGSPEVADYIMTRIMADIIIRRKFDAFRLLTDPPIMPNQQSLILEAMRKADSNSSLELVFGEFN